MSKSESWISYYEKNGKWRRLENENNDRNLMPKLQTRNKMTYDRILSYEDGMSILDEHFYHTFHLADDCVIKGSFDMGKHLINMNFPTNFVNQSCADIGCADGFITLHMAKNGGNVSCYDAWPMMIKHVKFMSHILDVPITNAEVHDITVKKLNSIFDTVVMMHVMCHAPYHRQNIVESIYDAVKHDGRLLFCDNNIESLDLIKSKFRTCKLLGKTKLEGCDESQLLECRK